MLEPPPHLTDGDVLATVQDHWDTDATSATYVALGFGAHHWRVGDLFVTLDRLGPRHSAATLEATYAGARALADAGLEFVLAPLPSRTGAMTVPLHDGLVSVTPWVDAPRSTTPADAATLERLHATVPPPGLRHWAPLVGSDLAQDLAARTSAPWLDGPHGEQARSAVVERLDAISGWVADYHRLAAAQDPVTWVATHGEPHERNLLTGRDGPLLVDWESLMLAPRERDHVHAGLTGDPDAMAMFDLEWRLDEIAQYSAWFEQPHGDTADDRTALGGLRHELAREARHSAT